MLMLFICHIYIEWPQFDESCPKKTIIQFKQNLVPFGIYATQLCQRECNCIYLHPRLLTLNDKLCHENCCSLKHTFV